MPPSRSALVYLAALTAGLIVLLIYKPWVVLYIFLGILATVALILILIRVGSIGVKDVDPVSLIPGNGPGNGAGDEVEIVGSYNTRDVGGYKSSMGKTVRKNCILRSAAFNDPMKEGCNPDLKLVADLRMTKERLGHPNTLPDCITQEHIPIYDADKKIHTLMMTGHVFFMRWRIPTLMRDMYPFFIDTGAEAYAKLFRRMADRDNYPLLFHCSAGKDRTGIATMLLFDILGVSEEDMIWDYTLSNRCFESIFRIMKNNEQLKKMGINPMDLKMLFAADGAWIKNARAHLIKKYGSAEKYLVFHGGLDKEDIEKIRSHLLE